MFTSFAHFSIESLIISYFVIFLCKSKIIVIIVIITIIVMCYRYFFRMSFIFRFFVLQKFQIPVQPDSLIIFFMDFLYVQLLNDI